MRSGVIVGWLVMGWMCACSKPAAEEKAPAPVGSVSASASVSAAPAVVTPPPDAGGSVTDSRDPRFNGLGLVDRLMVEKNNRPADALKSDAVFDAVTTKLGAKLKNRSQLAGWPILASFCEKADTELNVDLVVCEYRDAPSLAKGKELALKNNTPRREILTVKSSTVSVTRFDETKDAAEQAKKIAELVKTLKD